jgi:hypothetical protein
MDRGTKLKFERDANNCCDNLLEHLLPVPVASFDVISDDFLALSYDYFRQHSTALCASFIEAISYNFRTDQFHSQQGDSTSPFTFRH